MKYQYEPLVTPQGWKEGERRFALGVSRLMDVLFHRLGRLESRLAALEKARQEGEEQT